MIAAKKLSVVPVQMLYWLAVIVMVGVTLGVTTTVSLAEGVGQPGIGQKAGFQHAGPKQRQQEHQIMDGAGTTEMEVL